MSDDSCIKCSTTVRPRQEALQCERCSLWQHRTCDTGISRDQYRQAVKDTIHLEWVCQGCVEPEPEPEPEPEFESEPEQDDDTSAAETSIVVERPFDIPEPNLEDSLQDNNLDDIVADHNPPITEYHHVEFGSNRGKRKLIDSDGYNYTVKKQKNDHILWRCSKRAKTLTCPATIIQDGDTYRPGLKNHCHPSEPGSHIAVKIKTEVKQKVKEAVYGQPTTAIVQAVMQKYADATAPAASRPNPSYLVRTGNLIRQGDRPQDPSDLNAELDLNFLDSNTPGFLQRDFLVGDKRHLIFYTDRQLQLLATAKTWYMDGTFRVVNNPWQQLFTIHAFVKSGDRMKQIPLVFCIMSGKRKEDYYEVLRFLDRRLPDRIALECIVADFEAGLWQAVKKRFPGYAIQGCIFHWCQAVFRKVQEHGLQNAYNQKDVVYNFLRQVMALPFLPPEHIETVFNQLDARAPAAVKPVMDYIYNTWMTSPIYEIHFWSIFMSTIRTNNDVEGWHNRFNSSVVTRGPVPFYHVISQLFAEAKDIPIQLKLVTEGKLQRYQRKKTRQVQGKVFIIWEQYISRTISASQVLKQCAMIYGPSV